MIQILDLDRPDLLAYRVTDVLTEEDVRMATDAFDTILDAHATVHLYAEVESLKGFEARALWLDLVTDSVTWARSSTSAASPSSPTRSGSAVWPG